MDQDTFSVEDVEYGAACLHAQKVTDQRGISDVDAQEVVALYTASQRSGLSLLDSLEVATGIVGSAASPVSVREASIDAFLERVADKQVPASKLAAGMHKQLSSRKAAPPRTFVGGRVYQRRLEEVVEEEVLLVGVDEQKDRLYAELKALFMYNPLTGVNQEAGARKEGVIFYGPPGTGKSSLCKYARQEGKRLSELSSLPFVYESFTSSDYSKWVGESAKEVRKKFRKVSDPSGVGVLVIDDVDLALPSRTNGFSDGRLQALNQFMQEMSGLEDYGSQNTLVLATTNRFDQVDAALLRRLPLRLRVDGYSSLATCEQFMEVYAPWASDEVRSYLADFSHKHSLLPSRMRDLVGEVNRFRRGPVDLDVLSLPFSERDAARERSFKQVSVPAAKRLAELYSS